MEQSKPKKHHFVPQFILKNFCIGKKKMLYVFDKVELKIFPSNVRNAGHENYFYQDDEMGYDISTESKLGKLETISAPIIENIIKEQSLPRFGSAEHRIICLFIVVQLTRTNETREFLSGFNENMASWIRGLGHDPNMDVENFKELTEAEIKQSSIDILRSTPGDSVKHLLEKEWSLQKTPKGECFYISDNPVTMHNNYPRQGRGNQGIGLYGIEIHFPISPRLCIVFMCSKMISDFRRKVNEHNLRISQGTAFSIDMSEPEKLVNSIDKKEVRELKPENVEFQNSLQVINSSRFVYSKSKGFELAKDMLKTNPELREPSKLWSSANAF